MSVLVGGLPIVSSSIAGPSASKRMFLGLWGETKVGKTTIAAGLDAITQTTLGKRTLIVACEQAQDAGLDRVAHLDIPAVVIRDDSQHSGFDRVLAVLRDPGVHRTYGGVVLDGFTELGIHSIQQYILANVPVKQEADKVVRSLGAMIERDFNVFQEAIRKILVACARLNDAGLHVVATCGARTYTHREKGNPDPVIDKIGPAFPGKGSVDTFETILPTIAEVTQRQVRQPSGPPVVTAFLEFVRSGKRLRGDRTGLWPAEAPAIVADDAGRPVSNLPAIFAEHWSSTVAANDASASSGAVATSGPTTPANR